MDTVQHYVIHYVMGRDVQQKCVNCKKIFTQTAYERLATSIMKHKPACSYKCNKALGQAK